jgi:hypothetical protein
MREADLSRRDTAFVDIRPSQRQCELSITVIGCGGILYNDDRANYFEYIAAALYNIRYMNLTCGDRCQRFDNRVSCMRNTRPQCRRDEQPNESTKQGIKHSLAERYHFQSVLRTRDTNVTCIDYQVCLTVISRTYL